MSSQLYLFAPENDMALAFGGAYYTPTPVASAIARDLSLLPLWYAGGDNAVVWAQQMPDNAMLAAMDKLGINARPVMQPPRDVTTCVPWGWSAYMVARLLRAGVDKNILPNEETISKIRTLSGRAISRDIIQALSHEGLSYSLPPLPQVLHTPDDVEKYVISQPVSMLKSPWSSSGRGVWMVRGKYDTATARAATGIIRKQGYIMGEQWQEKMLDCAMEFYSDGKKVLFSGYSLFETDVRGAYIGNVIDSNQSIECRLSQYIDIKHIHTTREALQHVLTRLVTPYYKGYLGVDMIIYRAVDGSYKLHPCIELNLRMSMGMVARIVADRYVSSEVQGVYRVEFSEQTGALYERHCSFMQHSPLHISEGKIIKGYMPLSVVDAHTRYMAYILVQ